MSEKGAAVDLECSFGRRALHIAAKYGHVETVRLLVDKNAEIDKVDRDGWTPLMIASQGGHAEVVEQLLPFLARHGVASDQR